MTDTEYVMTDRDFARVRSMIHRQAGIALGPHKREMVYSRLVRRLRLRQTTDFASYLDWLEASGDAREWQEFVNSLTTNLTAFFREEHHFPVLADLARRSPGPLTVWCAAASTGEEPYSIAMTICEALGGRAGGVKVIATDIDTDVLAKARAGVFTLDRVAGISQERLKRFFERGTGSNAGKVRVRQEVASIVQFARLNLLDASWPIKEAMDAIFCRNVMIYFDKATQKQILERFVPLLKPHGLLFSGHSENASLVCSAFRPLGHTVYAVGAHQAARP